MSKNFACVISGPGFDSEIRLRQSKVDSLAVAASETLRSRKHHNNSMLCGGCFADRPDSPRVEMDRHNKTPMLVPANKNSESLAVNIKLPVSIQPKQAKAARGEKRGGLSRSFSWPTSHHRQTMVGV
jgi:hypothetical protein